VTVARESALRAARRDQRAQARRRAPAAARSAVSIRISPHEGIRTTWGSKIFEHHVPEEDALIVSASRRPAHRGGQDQHSEFGAGANTFNAVFGATRNPWDPALTCGGRAGGRRRAGNGMGRSPRVGFGGSLRIPAPLRCGRFRTTPGLVPMYPKELAWIACPSVDHGAHRGDAR